MMLQSGLALDIYQVTQTGYFRLVTTVVLGMGISYGKLLFCHGISYQSKDNTISIIEYNDMTVYDCFNNTFSVNCGIPYLNLPPIPIYDSPRTNKRSRYTYDPLPVSKSVTPGNSVSTLTTPSNYPQLLETKF